jgi:hypothetical protein
MTKIELPAETRRRRGRSEPRHARRKAAARGPETQRCLVLACGVEDTTAVDLRSGALVRLRIDWDSEAEPALAPFDVVEVTLAHDPQRDDLAQPEAVTVEGLPTTVGTMRGRRVRRVMRHLVAPGEPHLLGFPGQSAPYWEFGGTRPSVALVVPRRGPLLFRRSADASVWVRFADARNDNWLPVDDRRALAALWAARRDRLSGKTLAAALGFRPHYLLVAVSRPRQGHCYKTVVAFLPRS